MNLRLLELLMPRWFSRQNPPGAAPRVVVTPSPSIYEHADGSPRCDYLTGPDPTPDILAGDDDDDWTFEEDEECEK